MIIGRNCICDILRTVDDDDVTWLTDFIPLGRLYGLKRRPLFYYFKGELTECFFLFRAAVWGCSMFAAVARERVCMDHLAVFCV